MTIGWALAAMWATAMVGYIVGYCFGYGHGHEQGRHT